MTGWKNVIRVLLIVLIGCWQLLVINCIQTVGGAFWFTDEISQKRLLSFLFYAPLAAYGLCWLIVSVQTRVLMIFAPILFWLVGFPLLGLTWGGLSSVSYNFVQLCALYDMQLVESRVVDARSKICTYESIKEDCWPKHKVKILRRETTLIPGLAWVRNLSQASDEK